MKIKFFGTICEYIQVEGIQNCYSLTLFFECALRHLRNFYINCDSLLTLTSISKNVPKLCHLQCFTLESITLFV